MDARRLTEIRERLDKRTQGEWTCVAAEFKGDGVVAFEMRMEKPQINFADGQFLTEAPADIRDLLEALRVRDEALRGMMGVACHSGDCGKSTRTCKCGVTAAYDRANDALKGGN